MSAEREAVPISTRSRDCLIAFEQCLSSASHPSLNVRQYSDIEDQIARFSVWTSNMAVFAAGKACLDHRLREAKDVHRLILGMLEALKARISECETHISLLPVKQDSSPQKWNDGFGKIVDALGSQVGLFHEVSNVIRKSSRQSQNDTAAKTFRIKDQEGNDLEDILKSWFKDNLCDRFPESSPSLRERLASTMVLRRKRILYRRDRYAAKPIKPLQPVSKPLVMPRSVVAQPLQNEEPRSNTKKTGPTLAMSQVQSAVKSATTLDPEKFRRASTPSVVSSTRYTEIDAHEDLAFPSPPSALKSDSIEVTCPYCLYALPSREVQNVARWRQHVLTDLDALVCLFDPCDQPEALYNHTKDWLRHMRKHTEHWRCTAKSHGLLKFTKFEEFLLHMKIDHKKNYTDSQIGLLADRGIQSSGPLFEFCPLCGGTSEGKDDASHNGMIGHIIGHLRSLALKSLPPIDVGESDTSPKDEHNSRSSWSTIKSLESDHGSPIGVGSEQDKNARTEWQELDVPQTDESTSELIWSEVRSIVQPGKSLPAFGDDDPILMGMLLYQSGEQSAMPPSEAREEGSWQNAIPGTGLAPFIFSDYDQEASGGQRLIDDHLRQTMLSDSEMRVNLTDYKLVRFKSGVNQSNGEIDWGTFTKADIQGMSKSYIRSEIRRLNATTEDVSQKQALLPASLDQCLTMELNILNQRDLNRATFLWSLAQIDERVREGYREKATLTAYFKRSLRPNANVRFWHETIKGQLRPTSESNRRQEPPSPPSLIEPLPAWEDPPIVQRLLERSQQVQELEAVSQADRPTAAQDQSSPTNEQAKNFLIGRLRERPPFFGHDVNDTNLMRRRSLPSQFGLLDEQDDPLSTKDEDGFFGETPRTFYESPVDVTETPSASSPKSNGP